MIERFLRPLSPRATERELSGALTALALTLSGFGVVMIFAATYLTSLNVSGKPWSAITHQVIWLVIGTFGFFLVSRVTPYSYRNLTAILLVGALGLLGAVLLPGIGSTVYGSSRWIVVGPLQLQPSELAKLILVLHLARFLSQRGPSSGLRARTIPALVAVGAMCGLVIIEPDMGTSILICVIGFGMLIGSGTRLWELLLTGIGTALVGAYFAFSTPYRRARMLSFLHPWAHRSTWSYQEVQALAAFATGHFGGVGLGAGQSSYSYLPNAQTDYIFAVIGQDLGFFGGLLVLLAFFVLVVVLLRSARVVRSPMNAIFTYGIAAWIGGQVVLNVGAVEGLLPVTGVPLPLVSAGGSSTVVIMVALGFVRGSLLSQQRKVIGDEETLDQSEAPSSPRSGRRSSASRSPVPRDPMVRTSAAVAMKERPVTRRTSNSPRTRIPSSSLRAESDEPARRGVTRSGKSRGKGAMEASSRVARTPKRGGTRG
ncbi:MAG: FtsW/RodA/SpoVE family cell cycle protein [Acidimicrobiales bacterium]